MERVGWIELNKRNELLNIDKTSFHFLLGYSQVKSIIFWSFFMQRCLIESDSALVSPDVLIEYCIRFTDFLVYIFFVRN